MKLPSTKVDRRDQRPYYSAREIDALCTEELRRTGLYPNEPQPIRIDRYIEKRFSIVPDYDDLGPGILGVTQFGKSGVIKVVVSRSLEEEGTIVGARRVRATLAHESGHALLHAHLFANTGQCALFPEGDATTARVLCRAESALTRRNEWWEIQANLAIAGFLLPGALVRNALAEFLSTTGMLGPEGIELGNREAAAREVARVFDVNAVVARIRLDYLYPIAKNEQRSL